MLQPFDVAVDLGTPTRAVRDALTGSASAGTLVAARPVPALKELMVVADEEALPFRDGSLDLVVSALALHFVNDLPGMLIQVRRALKPDGLFLAAMLSSDTLAELRQSFTEAEAKSRAASRPASRRSRMCARWMRCCSVRASRCR